MYQFQGKASIFNGRFWRDVPIIRINATSLQVATARGVRRALKARRKGERIKGVSITLECLGRVLTNVSETETSNTE